MPPQSIASQRRASSISSRASPPPPPPPPPPLSVYTQPASADMLPPPPPPLMDHRRRTSSSTSEVMSGGADTAFDYYISSSSTHSTSNGYGSGSSTGSNSSSGSSKYPSSHSLNRISQQQQSQSIKSGLSSPRGSRPKLSGLPPHSRGRGGSPIGGRHNYPVGGGHCWFLMKCIGCFLPLVLTLTLLGVGGWFWVQHSDHIIHALIRDDVATEEMVIVAEFEERVAQLQHENQQLQLQAARVQELEQHLNHERDHTQHVVTTMQRNLQLVSKRHLIEKYGAGPHRIEVFLEFTEHFPKVYEHSNNIGRFVIELAPIGDMPHTVFWFLEHVHNQRYDGTSFYRNAPHILLGGPERNFLTPDDVDLARPFAESGSESVMFQEYSHDFPHRQWTIGLAGRPGGPHFYVNTQDNVQLHGPGGQGEASEPDPCFGKIIDGFDAVERMQRGTRHDNERLVDPVAIKSMRIIWDD